MEETWRAMEEAARLEGRREMLEKIEKKRAGRKLQQQRELAREEGEIVEEPKAADVLVTPNINGKHEDKQQPVVKAKPDVVGPGGIDAPGTSAEKAKKTSEVTATKAQLTHPEAIAGAKLAKLRKQSEARIDLAKASQALRLRDFHPPEPLPAASKKPGLVDPSISNKVQQNVEKPGLVDRSISNKVQQNVGKPGLVDRFISNKSQQDIGNPLASWNARKEKEGKKEAGIAATLDTSLTTLNGRKASGKGSDITSPKRNEPSTGFGDERRQSKKRASISERVSVSKSSSSVSSPQSPESPDESLATEGTSRAEREPPGWYQKLNFASKRAKGRADPESSNMDVLFNALKAQIKKAQEQVKKAKAEGRAINLRDIFAAVREKLHSAFFLLVTAQALRNTRMLDNLNGLPQIFDEQFAQGVSWPYDIRADAEELYNKWCREDFETDLMRGIECAKPKKLNKKEVSDRASDKLSEGYPRIKADYFGGGKLLNGQWWPTQLTCLRDGAHGSSQGGIYSGRQGVYSCIMADGYSDDEDHGDVVLYCGTDDSSRKGDTTEETKRMMLSMNKNKVRLIRSSKVPSSWAPEKGFRYDGLYDVVSKERIDPEGHPRARHRFKLVRCPGQDPIRGGNGPEKRPTRQELEAYEKDKHLRGF